MKKGVLITFEGIEGSGKTTQISALAEYLDEKGWKILKTREPGGTKLGERIRDLLLDVQHQNIVPKTELLLYLASRAQHFQEVIRPALVEDKVVLCDRFSEATLAYQGYGRGLDLEKIKNLLKYVTEGRNPDLTLLLDLEARQGCMRIRSRTMKDRLEQERIEFYENVRQGYLKLAKMAPRRIIVIDASQAFERVSALIRKTVEAFLNKHVVRKHRRP
jgi:dTMP kinase